MYARKAAAEIEATNGRFDLQLFPEQPAAFGRRPARRRITMMQIGFVGLGSMGLPMASNLARAGFRVQGFDVRSAALAELARAGGEAAPSSAAAAAGARHLILMVVNAEQADHVLFRDEALQALPNDATIILMATCPPHAVQHLAERVVESGRTFLDAPVSGGVVGAKGASLSIMAAGPDDVLAAAHPCSTLSAGGCSTSVASPARAQWRRPSTSYSAACTSPRRRRPCSWPAGPDWSSAPC
jgi:hypothetical protein